MKGLTTWLSFLVYNCEFVTFPLVSWVRCGTPDLCTLTYFCLSLVFLLTHIRWPNIENNMDPDQTAPLSGSQCLFPC